MTDRDSDPRNTECRLVIIDAHSMRILTSEGLAGPLLPRESIPPHARVAEALTGIIEQRCGLSTIQLALLPGVDGESSCAVHEITDSRKAGARSFSFVAPDEIAGGELIEEERATLLRIMTGEASEFGRFARLGWIDDLLSIIGTKRNQASGPAIRQLNQGINFCLISLKCLTGRNLWFKAVGDPNTREFRLTRELAQRFPGYLPKVVTWIPEWNGWISEETPGLPLNHSNDRGSWEQALAALALMQMNCAESTASLVASGATEWTCNRLQSLARPFFEIAQLAMRAQTSTKSKPIESKDLDRLQKKIEAALVVFANSEIPETILHGDIGHGNIIVSPSGPIFLDWAETWIGPPFLSAEHLLADLEHSKPELSREQSYLRRSYAQHWRSYTSPKSLEDVIALAPGVAAFVYALIAWDAHSRRPDPTRVWPLIRSMLRRAQRELESTSEVAA